jgi:hypothetical protein
MTISEHIRNTQNPKEMIRRAVAILEANGEDCSDFRAEFFANYGEPLTKPTVEDCTQYVARDMSFCELADLALELDRNYTEYENNNSDVKITTDIVHLISGEVLASRNIYGLWTINR